MKACILPLCLLALGQVSLGIEVDIRADTNRDGTVDTEGTSDVQGKSEWTESRGAIFLANIGDTDRRCSIELEGAPIQNERQIAACNDASDDVQRAPQYMAPLRTLPLSGLSTSAVGQITTDETSQALVRIFRRQQDDWMIVTGTTEFTSEELASGLELGIDARDTRRPEGWDGRTNVTFTVTDGQDTGEDSVMLRVAPVLTHHHASPAQRIFVTSPNGENMRRFVAGLEAAVANAGIEEPVHRLTQTEDIWTQDYFEPGYSSMPGPDGAPVSLRITIRSTQDRRPAGRVAFTELRNTGIGAVQQLGGVGTSMASMGNLECIPPYSLGGRSYPAGRIIMGTDPTVDFPPSIIPFLRAQEAQDPVLLDTAWLYVGHVDEFVQFLPAPDSPRGWVVMASDTAAGIRLLQDAEAAGHGDERAFSRSNDSETSSVPGFSISEMLRERDLVRNNGLYAERIAANLEILKRETGVTDDEIHWVPAIYRNARALSGPPPEEDDEQLATASAEDAGEGQALRSTSVGDAPPDAPSFLSIKEAAGEDQDQAAAFSTSSSSEQDVVWALAYYPGMINGLVLSGSQYLSPKPWGPIIDGEDIFERAAMEVYGEVGYNVTFVDDWMYHQLDGEVHCGTNSFRDTSTPWW